jgi:hypothetical protein
MFLTMDPGGPFRPLARLRPPALGSTGIFCVYMCDGVLCLIQSAVKKIKKESASTTAVVIYIVVLVDLRKASNINFTRILTDFPYKCVFTALHVAL